MADCLTLKTWETLKKTFEEGLDAEQQLTLILQSLVQHFIHYDVEPPFEQFSMFDIRTARLLPTLPKEDKDEDKQMKWPDIDVVQELRSRYDKAKKEAREKAAKLEKDNKRTRPASDDEAEQKVAKTSLSQDIGELGTCHSPDPACD